MAFKLNISEKGKAWKMETEEESLVGKNVGDTISGKEISPDFEGYELLITGGSDSSGFPMSKDVDGLELKALLLKKGWGMRTAKPAGLRLRKTVRGKVISLAVSQINMSVAKSGKKPLSEIFPTQNQPKVEAKKEAPKAE